MNDVKKILAPTISIETFLGRTSVCFQPCSEFSAREVTVYHVINRDEIMQFSEQLKRLGNPLP